MTTRVYDAPAMSTWAPVQVRLSDDYTGFARLWRPPSPRSGVLYLHGIQSHGLWYEASAARLAEAGWAVLLPDRRGSGRNERDRGHAPSARRLLLDAAESLNELHARTGFSQFHVVGVSWGGKLALALQRFAPERVLSLSLLAPGLFPLVDLKFADKVRVGLSALTAPHTLFDIPLQEPELFTANPVRQQFIRDDPLKLTKVTTGFLLASRRLDRYVLAGAKHSRSCPLRVYLAGRDRIIDNHATKDFIRHLRWPSREIIEYDEAHHTLEFEPDPEPFFADLVEFLVLSSQL